MTRSSQNHSASIPSIPVDFPFFIFNNIFFSSWKDLALNVINAFLIYKNK